MDCVYFSMFSFGFSLYVLGSIEQLIQFVQVISYFSVLSFSAV